MRYKLTPLADRMDDPAWGGSATRATIYVGAQNEMEARQTAALKLAIGGGAKPSGRTPDDTIPGRNPWLDPQLTDCVEVNDISGDSMMLGEVITADASGT